ncbi:MAG: glycoside hydrolase family 38 C-terminal domain-containing protein [Candidatus Hydrogenedentota bacterium]
MKAFYVAGTHWDREWYEPFQEFRMWLVELIDELLDLLESSDDYPVFHLDGQAVVLEDYLEIRPENAERLAALLKAGRLVAGPWYNLPDEWLISGESYVRNLMKGRRICRDMGFAPMDFLYTPDQFGHIAALPLIANGFGLDTGICWRGSQNENFPAQFVWVGPDGSRMVTHKLIDSGGYDVFGCKARRPMKEKDFSDESFKEIFDPYFQGERERAEAPLALLLDAVDHQRPDRDMPRFFEMLRERYPDVEFIWGRLDEYGAEMRRHAGKLPERTGELREPCRSKKHLYQYLIVHTISSRYPLKQRNDACQALLEKWAEPAALFQMMHGGAPILKYLDHAWTWLLKNHPHDSICGCSIDQVHKDMMFRFDQAEMVGEGVVRRATAQLANASAEADDWKHLVLHNPLPYPRTEVVEFDIPFPLDYAEKTGHQFKDALESAELVNTFYLKDAQGNRVPYQHVSIERRVIHKRINDMGRKTVGGADVYRVAAVVTLPAAGHTCLTVEGTDDATRTFGSLRTAPLTAENERIRIEVHPNGTVTLTHLASGKVFENLFTYEDSGDAGDGWTRGPLVNDLVFYGPGDSVAVAVDEDGPLRTVFRIERTFHLPTRTGKDSHVRAEERTPLHVIDRLYVEKHRPGLRVRTTIVNTIRDHRLRVLFPTHIPAEKSFAETPFAFVERDIAIPPETATWQERVHPETAFTSVCGLQDGKVGLALLAPTGLHEYAVTETEDRSLALTLFRATLRTVMTNGEPDGQLLGAPMHFDYTLLPFSGPLHPADALRRVASDQVAIHIHQTAQPGPDVSHVQVEGDGVVVTALKPAADTAGGVIRLWNPGNTAQSARVHCCKPVKTAQHVNLDEQVGAPLTPDNAGALVIEIPARALVSVLFTW